jgi:hypothetical protein
MRHLKNHFLFIFLIIQFFSCNTDTKEERIDVPSGAALEKINLSDDLEIHKIIALETTDSVLLGSSPYKVYEHRKRIFVFDPSVGKGLYIFDFDGNFLNKITNNAGEGDYLLYQSQDFVIIPEENQLGIFDLKTQRLLFFDLNNYSYSHSIDLPRPTNNLEFFNGSYYLNPSKRTDSENGYFIEQWNKDLTELNGSFFPYHENSNGNFRLSHKMTHNEESLSFWEPFNDTIYFYNTSRQPKKWVVNFPSKIPSDLYKKPLAEKLQFVQSIKSGYIFINNVVYTPRVTMFNFISENGPINLVYQKGSAKISKKIQIDELLVDNIIGYANANLLFTYIPDKSDYSNPKLVLLKLKGT